MEKIKSPAISIVMYVVGIIFLVISAFMLVLAIDYTRTYLESYDASFADMWSNSLQYIIKEFVPYLGIGLVSIGIGIAVKEMRVARAEVSEAAKATIQTSAGKQSDEESHPDYTKAIEKLEAGIRHLEKDIDTTREILSIKIEEKEKRDAYRIRGLGEDVMSVIEGTQDEVANPVAADEQNVEHKEVKPISLFRVAQTMAMPDIPKVKAKKAKKAPQKKKTTAEKSKKTSKTTKTGKTKKAKKE